jgi:hypothetical protein
VNGGGCHRSIELENIAETNTTGLQGVTGTSSGSGAASDERLSSNKLSDDAAPATGDFAVGDTDAAIAIVAAISVRLCETVENIHSEHTTHLRILRTRSQVHTAHET